MEVKAGEPVTLYIVPAQALPRELVLEYAERSLRAPIGGLAAGDPQVRKKILEATGWMANFTSTPRRVRRS